MSVCEEGLHEHMVEAEAFLLHHADLQRDLRDLARLLQTLDHRPVGNEVVAVAVLGHLREELLREFEVPTLVGCVD